jgi:hypothetical protein
MVVNLVTVSWGPQFQVPAITIKKYYGNVVLRETLDEELLKQELESMQIEGCPVGANNVWYIRKKGTQTWIKIGESWRWEQDFAVRLDTTTLGNGTYQVLGFMSVKIKTAEKEVIVSRQSIADFVIKN